MRRTSHYRKRFNRQNSFHDKQGEDIYLNSDPLGDSPFKEESAQSSRITLSGSKAAPYVDDEVEEDTSIDSYYDKYKRNRLNQPIPASTWFDVRKHFIQGERVVTEAGSIVSENVSIATLAKLYRINYRTLLKRYRKEGWKKYRQAYLARVNEFNTGLDLDFHTDEIVTSETSTINTLNNLTSLVDTYIESKYGEILEATESFEKQLSEKDKEIIASNTDIQELKEITNIISNIYRTQKAIYDSSPVGQQAKLDKEALSQGKTTSGMSSDNDNLTDKQRQALLNSVRAKLENLSKLDP